MIRGKEKEVLKKIKDKSNIIQNVMGSKYSILDVSLEAHEFKDRFFNNLGECSYSNDMVIKKKLYLEIEIPTSIQNTTFYGCIFEKCKFDEVVFLNVIFEKCIFLEVNDPSLFRINNLESSIGDGLIIIDSIFQNSLWSICASNTTIYNNYFVNAGLVNFKISNSDFRENTFYKCSFSNSKISDSNMFDTIFVENNISDIIFDKVKIYYNTYFGISRHLYYLSNSKNMIFNYIFNNYVEHDYYRLSGMNKKKKSYQYYYLAQMNYYKSISLLYKNRNSLTHSGDYNYYRRKSEMFGRNGVKQKFTSFIAWLTCGFGERPSYAIKNSLVIIFLFSIIYTQTGIIVDGKLRMVNNLVSIKDIILDTTLFSFTTFVSLGYGYMSPFGVSKIMSIIEMILGVLLIGLWIASLTKKILK